MDTRDLVAAVQRGDVARLTGIPGVGKKTAERIVLELRDRLLQIATPMTVGESVAADGHERLRADLLSALQNLGYHRPQAEKAIDSVLNASGSPTLEQALRSALRELMR
jgi:Holliday junction DNA helicase RuvA